MTLMPVEEARNSILAGVQPLSSELVHLDSAHLRVLARDVLAKRDQPPFAASAMDGYAVNSADAETVGSELKVIGTSAAGHAFRGALGRGEAVRIFTGAPVPMGADTVLIQENAVASAGSIRTTAIAKPGQHVRPLGLDFRKGECVLRAGRLLSARDIGLAASMNYPRIAVRRRPVVALLATGDELVDPGSSPRRDQITSSNTLALSAFVRWAGAVPLIIGTVADDRMAIRSAIRRARTADVLIITGGASVGEHDLVKAALEAEGIRITFWKIAMRPGKPLLFAVRKRQRILGLPGNPVSALVCARVFLKPLVDRLLGKALEDTTLTARLGAPMRANDERQEYARASLVRKDDGSLIASPYPSQDSSMLRVLAGADCLIVRPPHAPAAAVGQEVQILPIDF
jgi:molybdopterin molybdotransferase